MITCLFFCYNLRHLRLSILLKILLLLPSLELVKRYPEKILSAFISGIIVKPVLFQFTLKVQSWLVYQVKKNERYQV